MSFVRMNVMQIELIENPPILPTRNEQITTLALHDDRRNSCGVQGYSVNDETKSAEEHIRLLLSWSAVLEEIGFSELVAGPW
jgi:hypothetical protein